MEIYGFAKLASRWTVSRLSNASGRTIPVAEVATFKTMAGARDDCARRNLALASTRPLPAVDVETSSSAPAGGAGHPSAGRP